MSLNSAKKHHLVRCRHHVVRSYVHVYCYNIYPDDTCHVSLGGGRGPGTSGMLPSSDFPEAPTSQRVVIDRGKIPAGAQLFSRGWGIDSGRGRGFLVKI